jgi:hypothetical protein
MAGTVPLVMVTKGGFIELSGVVNVIGGPVVDDDLPVTSMC